MLRRTFLQLAGLATAGLSLPQLIQAKEASVAYIEAANQGNLIQAGWVLNRRLVSEFIRSSQNPYLSQVNADIRGTGKGQIALLWPFLEQAMGSQLIPHEQAIGDCFAVDTQVTMSDGMQKAIQEVNVGDYVISHTGLPRQVTRIIHKPYTGNMVKTTCQGYDSTVTSTLDHQFLTTDGQWEKVSGCESNLVALIQGLRPKIKSQELLQITDGYVYCLEVDQDNSFLANGYAVHNCVSHGYGLGVDILTATQIIKRKSPQKWVAKAATEIIYGGGRVEIAAQEYGMRWSGDGMTGTVAAEFVKRYGILLRQKYLNWDFTTYSGDLASELGYRGVPDPLESYCRIHPVGCVTLCRSWDEARDCIFNGYPVTLCSSQGFNTRYGRDKDGFLSPGRQPWMHCMLLAGIDDSYKRPGGVIINSWGDFIQGPKRHNQPNGSFWADASVIDRMCKQGDSIALSCYAGYPKQSYILW